MSDTAIVIINHLIIDVLTKDAKKLANRLKRLRSTIEIESIAPYRECMEYSQLILYTTKTEDQMDEWLYKTKHNCDYVGVVTIKD